MDGSALEEISERPEENHCMEKKEDKQPGLRERLKDEDYRNRLIHSLCICAALLIMGMNSGQLGPTLLDLQIITNTDLEGASLFVTLSSVGFLIGSFVCGLIYGKVNGDLLLFFAVLMSGVDTFVTPFCAHFELMLVVRFMAGFFSAFIETTCNVLLIDLWGTEGEGFLQFLHFCFAFGGVLSPIYSEPFLAPKVTESDSQVDEAMENFTYGNITTTALPEVPRDTNVKYAFFITAAASVIFAVPLLPLYVKNKRRKLFGGKVGVNRNQRKLPRSLKVLTMLMICIFFWMYISVEENFATYLMTFLVKEYDSVSKSKGAFATAVYWASFAIARFVMVFACRIFTSLQVLKICISLMVVCFTGFVICAYLRIVNALICFAALAGLAMSGVYPAAYSWTEAKFLKVTGFVSGMFQVSGTLAGMINPLVMGHMMESYSNMWFSYILFGQTVVAAVQFLALMVYARCYLNKKFGMSSSQSPGEDVVVQNSFLENDLEINENC